MRQRCLEINIPRSHIKTEGAKGYGYVYVHINVYEYG